MFWSLNSYGAKAGTVVLLLAFTNACEKDETQVSETDSTSTTIGGISGDNGGAFGSASNGGRTGGNTNEAGGSKFGTSFTSSIQNQGLPVDLGTAINYVILAKSGISTVPPSAITGNVGLSPAATSFVTGFSVNADATNAFSTSQQVTGKLFAADHAQPTPTDLTKAIGDMQLAFADAATRAPKVSELGAGDVGGKTLGPGVYRWSTGLSIPTNVTLKGNNTDVWIFQIAQNLTVSNGTKVMLAGGALAKNVFWQVAGLVDFGTTAHGEGIVLTQTSVTLGTGASLNGRLFAQTAVNIDSSTVAEPAQ